MSQTPQPFKRALFTISRETEFFSEGELTKQIGVVKPLWPLAVLKELVDNALDASEQGDVPPAVSVRFMDDHFQVEDNGPGIPERVITDSLNYAVRVSDKVRYVGPTRGQQGNGLKTVWAAPFVASADRVGVVEVATRGVLYRVTVRADPLKGRPRLDLDKEPSDRTTGAAVRVRWPGLGRMLDLAGNRLVTLARNWVGGYAIFNPHARFSLRCGDSVIEHPPPTNPGWEKWRADRPSSPGWYTHAQLHDLVAGLLEADGDEGKTTVRELIGTFAGLTATAKQKRVYEQAGLRGPLLRDMVRGDDIDAQDLARLHLAMKEHSKPVPPANLGLVGKAHLLALQRVFR